MADLATARAIAATPEGAALRFVTRQGELLEADGRFTVGTHHAETGILSRKSELRELRQQAIALDERSAEAEREFTGLRDRAEALEQPLYDLQQRINELVEEAGEMSARVKLHRQKRSGLEDEVALSRDEIGGLEREIGELTGSWAEGADWPTRASNSPSKCRRRRAGGSQHPRARNGADALREQECSQARVELAQIEERLAGRRRRAAQLDADLVQRQREATQAQQHETATATPARRPTRPARSLGRAGGMVRAEKKQPSTDRPS